jgi:hypothetical protein
MYEVQAERAHYRNCLMELPKARSCGGTVSISAIQLLFTGNIEAAEARG